MSTVSTASETARLKALHRYQILDTDAENSFDDLVQLAAHVCETPIAAINFIDLNRQWLKAKVGLEIQELPREIGLCPMCLAQAKVLVIPDTYADPQWRHNSVVIGEPYARFYAGIPLMTLDGHLIGTLFVVDQLPRSLSEDQIDALEKIARQVIAQLELRRHLITLANSIAERQQAEAIIQEQAALLDIATDAILVRNLENRIIFWSKGAERLFGWTSPEAIGKSANELLYKEQATQVKVALQTVLQHGEWFGELHKVTKAGKEVVVESRWALVQDAAGQPKSILTVDRDVTEKKQLETQFFHAQRLESIGTLASRIAHDLNNILTPILAIAQLLPIKLKPMDQHTQQLLQMLETNSKRGADLVRQVLSFSRGVEGKRMIVQPRHLILEIEKILRETFPKSIESQTDIPQNLWTVLGDSTQLHQVIMNLCVNARDAMPSGGQLKIAAYNQQLDENFVRMQLEARIGNYIVISVSDTGMGIPPEIVDLIFEPFFTTKELGRGTGLGLATVMGIVKSHGGFVKVASQTQSGTEFKVFLPAVLTPEAIPTEMPKVPHGAGRLILVVDDEMSVRSVLQASLESFDYQVLVASDGIEAIALYAQHKSKVAVILLDLIMPDMDGLTTIRALRKMNPNVRIAAMSGLAARQLVEEATDNGVNQFLSKPFTINELLQVLYEAFPQAIECSDP